MSGRGASRSGLGGRGCDGSRPSPEDGAGGPRARDEGLATLLVALSVVLLSVLCAAGVVLSSALSARSATQAAADLGALAGASIALESPERVCGRAAAVVRANGARTTSCWVDGVAVRVEVAREAPAAIAWLLPGRRATLRGRAHAELVADQPALQPDGSRQR